MFLETKTLSKPASWSSSPLLCINLRTRDKGNEIFLLPSLAEVHTHTNFIFLNNLAKNQCMCVVGWFWLGGGGEKWLTTLTPFPVSPCLNVFLSRYIYDYFFKKYHASLFFFLSLSLAFSVSFHFLFLLGPFSLWLFVRSSPCFISKRQSKFTIHTLFWRWQRQTKGCMCYMSVMGT